MPDENTVDEQTTDTSTVLGGPDTGDEKPEGDVTDTGDQKPEGDKPEGDDKGDGDETPDAYEFEMPEGMELDTALAEAATPILQKYKVTQEDAQALASAMAESQGLNAEAAVDAYNKQVSDWGEELKKDADFGGDAFDKNAGATHEWLDKMVPKDIKEELLGKEGLFESTGIGSHPALVKFFFDLSKRFPVAEDDPESGGVGSGEDGDQASRMYPNEAKS